MHIPEKVRKAGGKPLEDYVRVIYEIEGLEISIEDIEQNIKTYISNVEHRMDLVKEMGSITHQTAYFIHPVPYLSDENPLMYIYEAEEHLKDLREISLRGREFHFRVEYLRKKLEEIIAGCDE